MTTLLKTDTPALEQGVKFKKYKKKIQIQL